MSEDINNQSLEEILEERFREMSPEEQAHTIMFDSYDGDEQQQKIVKAIKLAEERGRTQERAEVSRIVEGRRKTRTTLDRYDRGYLDACNIIDEMVQIRSEMEANFNVLRRKDNQRNPSLARNTRW